MSGEYYRALYTRCKIGIDYQGRMDISGAGYKLFSASKELANCANIMNYVLRKEHYMSGMRNYKEPAFYYRPLGNGYSSLTHYNFEGKYKIACAKSLVGVFENNPCEYLNKEFFREKFFSGYDNDSTIKSYEDILRFDNNYPPHNFPPLSQNELYRLNDIIKIADEFIVQQGLEAILNNAVSHIQRQFVLNEKERKFIAIKGNHDAIICWITAILKRFPPNEANNIPFAINLNPAERIRFSECMICGWNSNDTDIPKHNNFGGVWIDVDSNGKPYEFLYGITNKKSSPMRSSNETEKVTPTTIVEEEIDEEVKAVQSQLTISADNYNIEIMTKLCELTDISNKLNDRTIDLHKFKKYLENYALIAECYELIMNALISYIPKEGNEVASYLECFELLNSNSFAQNNRTDFYSRIESKITSIINNKAQPVISANIKHIIKSNFKRQSYFLDISFHQEIIRFIFGDETMKKEGKQ